MILRRLTLTNFRQFVGTQTIDFATGQGQSSQNVTVIFGENGRGKTGIFRAVLFCLFGDRRLSQDGDIADADIQLVNASALYSEKDQPVTCSVELRFEHGGREYVLQRSIRGMLRNSRVIEEITGVTLTITDRAGNTERIKGEDISAVIAGVLDPRVKEYFLFDGEKIERLTRASGEQRKEISRGIRNLLKLDALENAIRSTERLKRELENQVSSKSTTELARLMKALQENEDTQNRMHSRLDEVLDEAARARNEIARLDKELEKYLEVKHLVARRQQLEQQLESLEQNLKDSRAELRAMLTRTAMLMAMEPVSKVFDSIDRKKKSGEIPSQIRRDLIDRILADRKCICGCEISEGTDAYHKIVEWRNRTEDTASQDSALDLWRWLGELKNRYADFKQETENALLAHGKIKSAMEETRRKKKEVSDLIGAQEREDASRLEGQRQQLEAKETRLQAEALNLKESLEQLGKEHEQQYALLEQERHKRALVDELSRRALLARDTNRALTAVHESFANEVRLLIGDSASRIFAGLLDREGRENLRRIVVNKDYTLEVEDRWNRPFLANISAGQRQVMSISFIAALAQAAYGGGAMEMPFFMDTPFGRLSSEHRQNLIAALPQLCSQWIILATDTEFTRQEASLLASSGRWGRFYNLAPDEAGNTICRTLPVEEVPAVLADRSEIL